MYAQSTDLVNIFPLTILLIDYKIGECKEYYEDPWIFGEEEETEDSADGEGEADESGSGEGSGAVGKKPRLRILNDDLNFYAIHILLILRLILIQMKR